MNLQDERFTDNMKGQGETSELWFVRMAQFVGEQAFRLELRQLEEFTIGSCQVGT